MKPATDPRAQAKEIFHAVGRKKGIAQDLLGFLSDPVDAARALDEADDGPRQIVIHDDVGILEVLPFAEDVGRQKDADFLFRRNHVALPVAFRTEAPSVSGRIVGPSRDARKPSDASRGELVFEVLHGVGELAEDEDLVVRVALRDEPVQRVEFCVAVRFPFAAAAEYVEQAGSVAFEILAERIDEEIRAQPFEAGLELRGIQLVNFGGALSKFGFGAQPALRERRADFSVSVLFIEKKNILYIIIAETCVEKLRFLCADRQRQSFRDRVQKDVVAQNVTLDRELKRVSAAFEPLEEVDPAKAHQSLSGARQGLQQG